MRKTVLFGFCIILLLGCAKRISETMDSWVGHNINEAIAAWGPPTSTYPAGNGGTVYVWSNYVPTGSSPGQVNFYNNYATYTAPQQYGYNRTRTFITDSSGTIISWNWRGL